MIAAKTSISENERFIEEKNSIRIVTSKIGR